MLTSAVSCLTTCAKQCSGNIREKSAKNTIPPSPPHLQRATRVHAASYYSNCPGLEDCTCTVVCYGCVLRLCATVIFSDPDILWFIYLGGKNRYREKLNVIPELIIQRSYLRSFTVVLVFVFVTSVRVSYDGDTLYINRI